MKISHKFVFSDQKIAGFTIAAYGTDGIVLPEPQVGDLLSFSSEIAPSILGKVVSRSFNYEGFNSNPTHPMNYKIAVTFHLETVQS